MKAPAALGRFGPIAYSLANNHTLDQGTIGLEDTFNALDTAGARYFGAGKNIAEATKPLLQTFQLGDSSLTVAVFGGLEYNRLYAEQYHFYAGTNNVGVATIDLPAVKETIRELRQQTPNLFVVYFMHVLQNYSWKTSYQVTTATALRNAGVDLVIGSGAHMMQEVEFNGNQWTFYGLGNFVFNAGGRTSAYGAPPYSFSLIVDFSMNHDRLLTDFHAYPIVSDNKVTIFKPRFLGEEELSIVDALLSEKSHWNTATCAAVKRGKDEIGWYFEFSHLHTANSCN